MVTCQSANQLKTPAKVSWAFKMVSQFGSLGYTIMRKIADLTVVQKTIIDTLHKEGKPQTFIAKEAGCSQSAVSRACERSVQNIVGARSGFLFKGRSDRSVSLRFRSDTAHTTSLGHAQIHPEFPCAFNN